MTDEERRTDYERSAHQPWRWKSAADNLFEAAAHLRCLHEKAMSEVTEQRAGGAVPQGFFMDQQAHYFEGKCIELYLKCLLIKSGAQVAKNGEMTRGMMSHDLLKFCRNARFDVTASECETLRKLTESVTFWGTYPIPTKVRSWRPEVAGMAGVLLPIWFWTPGDTENYIEVVSRLREMIGPIEFSI